MTDDIRTLEEWINDTPNTVFYSGAGVSAESGVPDYRHYHPEELNDPNFPPEAIFSRIFFQRKPFQFFNHYRKAVIAPLLTAEPNDCHKKVAEMEEKGHLRCLITQNTDNLHQEAGSKKVLELYGNVMRNNCPLKDCDHRLATLDLYNKQGVPYCDVDMCGAVMTPDIFLYGDLLDPDMMLDAAAHILMCRMLIIAGTDLHDDVGAGILNLYDGKRLVIISPKESPYDKKANLIIRANVSEVMAKLNIT